MILPIKNRTLCCNYLILITTATNLNKINTQRLHGQITTDLQ